MQSRLYGTGPGDSPKQKAATIPGRQHAANLILHTEDSFLFAAHFSATTLEMLDKKIAVRRN